MSLYECSGMEEPQPARAPQACMSCRKQKRKCSKSLPACALCQRMSRHCDYSDTAPAPTAEDFNALRMKLTELEAKLSCRSKTLQIEQQPHHAPIYSPPPDVPWLGIQNKFPIIAFLDSFAFNSGGIPIPKTTFETPPDVLEALGAGSNVQTTLTTYFATVHQWLPILSKKKLTRNMANPLWELGPDLALLYLCMKLIISRPADGFDCSQSQIYLTAKRFIFLIESTGLISLLILQANILITLYEYSHAIYPAAWMSSGWSIRYSNLLGISGDEAATNLLGKPSTWVDQEERRRTWWAALLVDRIISIGSMGYILNSQEPKDGDSLPIDDSAWDSDELLSALQSAISTTTQEILGPFSRFCQASMLMGRVMTHHKAEFSTETEQFTEALRLFTDVSELARKITAEAATPKLFFNLISPLALTYSTLCYLCNHYCFRINSITQEQKQMQAQASDSLKTAAAGIIAFTEQVNAATPSPIDLDRVSPLIMDAIYAGASILAWLSQTDESCHNRLESLRQCLIKLSTRWRNAAEYVRILEAQQLRFALTSNST